MIKDETIKQLSRLSVPRTFKQNEYICYEGQPGHEMYIILRGSVGVYVASAINTMVEVSRIMAGDFFGEMSVFDGSPRSASCIALEDTICVALSKDNLREFFAGCPDMAVKLMENMSGRIRRLDNELYKTEKFVQNTKLPKFTVPAEYSFSHEVEEPHHDLAYTEPVNAPCPVCGKEITVMNLKRSIMSVRKIAQDGRLLYAEYDPLWTDIWSCPYCNYSNHYLSFFRMLPFKREYIKRILKEQHTPVLEQQRKLNTKFDQLFLRYIQAIHINEAVNSTDSLYIGKLWLNLCWLFEDACDDTMRLYCSERAADHIQKALDGGEIKDDAIRYSLTLTLAHRQREIGRTEKAIESCNRAAESEDTRIKKNALMLLEEIRKG